MTAHCDRGSTRTPAGIASAISAVSRALRVSEAAGKGKAASAARLRGREANVVDGYCAKRRQRDAECLQILQGLTA